MNGNIDDMTLGVVTVIENQNDADKKNSKWNNLSKDTNSVVQRLLTLKQFIGGLVVMWILTAFAGEFISHALTSHQEVKHMEYNQMSYDQKIDALIDEIQRLTTNTTRPQFAEEHARRKLAAQNKIERLR